MNYDCSWPVSYSACATDEAGNPTCFEDADERLLFETLAIDALNQWTGLSVGACEVTVRPCKKSCIGGAGFFNSTWSEGKLMPTLIGGDWYNLRCGSCNLEDDCSCTTVQSLILPGPIYDILDITIDGVVLDPTAYRVDDYNRLIRQDGFAWPACQDFSIETGVEGTWSITYVKGMPVPLGGQIAAGLLACELKKSACNDSECALPQRIQQITRQGVTVEIMNDFKDIDEGRFGIWLVDSWVASVMRPARRSTVRSPDYRRGNRPSKTTWTIATSPAAQA